MSLLQVSSRQSWPGERSPVWTCRAGSCQDALMRFVRAEGRADEAFWLCTCKLLPPELWRAALGARQSGQTCPKGSGTAASRTGNKPEDLGSDALTSQGGPGEEGASGQPSYGLQLHGWKNTSDRQKLLVMELSALLVQSQKQNEEKEKTVKTLNNPVEILEASLLEKEYEASLTKSVKEENLSVQKLIKDITEVVLDECASVVTDSSQQAESINVLSCLSSVDAERAFVLVQEALARRRGAAQPSHSWYYITSPVSPALCSAAFLSLISTPHHNFCLQALKEELSARQDSISFLLHQHRQQEEKCRKLQQSLEQLEQECQMASSHQQHLQSLVEALRRLKDLAALEEKHSLLESELVVARETLEESHLQRDLLKQEKRELTMALEKGEQSVAELRGAQNKPSAEVADLHVAAAKMSSVSEALALDKVRLNKLVSQLEQENEVLSGKVAEMERVRSSDQEKLSLCEGTNEELSAEKAHLEQLLKKVEEQREGLQEELRILAEEKAETQEQLSQVYRQQESARSGLSSCARSPLTRGMHWPWCPKRRSSWCTRRLP
ncbi:centrosome-associated protein CEP250-like isoform X3 [Strix aluco]|uniref:centrosome-associated protein CEP250-like isoform X3 n=1 Tax=Strix aluco TaxID=111821 RepID=UPI003DA38ECE